MQFHLSSKVLFGVNVGRGAKGVIEEDESVSLRVEGQVGARAEDTVLSIACCEREKVVWRKGQDVLQKRNIIDTYV